MKTGSCRRSRSLIKTVPVQFSSIWTGCGTEERSCRLVSLSGFRKLEIYSLVRFAQVRTNNDCIVQFVDYGNSQLVKSADLKPLPSDHRQPITIYK